MNIPPCFVCGKEVENVSAVADDEDINQPYAATTFMTHGHYGSTVFDPMSPDNWIEINVCDECLVERKDRVLFGLRLPKGFTKPVQYEPWNPFKHN